MSRPVSNSSQIIDTDLNAYMQAVGARARSASRSIANAPSASKDAALGAIADVIEASFDPLQSANACDMSAGRQNKLSAAMLDRLELTNDRIQAMADGVRKIAKQLDPVGEITDMTHRPSGLQVGKMRVPLGVIGIIYESRPNVTVDAAALCLKSGNAAILRGGSEAIHSNRAIAACIQQGIQSAGLSTDIVQMVDTADRAAVSAMITMNSAIDIIIPRGGKGLIDRINRKATVPVIKHLDGICHVYIAADADPEKAIAVAVNSKTYRYGICGAMETLLVDVACADTLLPPLAYQLSHKGVEMRGCERAVALVTGMTPASEEDWRTEYLAPVLSVRVVDGIESAIAHIATYGSSHTDAIVTENLAHAQRFLREVDSSSVMLNAATCFADGGEYGLGAEIGISTDKLHVRGPVGVWGLTTQKYIVIGQGTTR